MNAPGPRVILTTGIFAGVLNAVLFPITNPEHVGFATDVYYAAGRAALAGNEFYATLPGAASGFRYPPLAVVGFSPHALLGDPGLAYLLQTALNLVTAGALAILLVRFTDRAEVGLDRIDRLLIAGYAFFSVAATTNLVMGQINHQLALAIAGGAVLLERNREEAGGIAFGLAAFVKLFPALVGVWLLRRSAWRAIVAATVTGLSLLGIGTLIFGTGALETYVTKVVAGEAAVASFPDGPDPTEPYVTVRRQLVFLFPGLPSAWLFPVSLGLLGPVFVGVNRIMTNRTSRLVAFQGTLLATLILFPLEPFYLILSLFPLVPLLYLLESGTPRRLFLGGALVLSVPTTYDTVVTMVSVLALPAGVESVIQEIVRGTFSFALPPMYGIWLVLGACLLHQHQVARSAEDGLL
ncbi:MAG: hypothetical protein ACI9PP_002007 [Halobacteriales archaeon]|jgi:hypothetical protein